MVVPVLRGGGGFRCGAGFAEAFQEAGEGVIEDGAVGFEPVAAGGFQGVEAPAVAAGGEDVEFGGDVIGCQALVVAEAVFGVDAVVDAVEEEGRRGVGGDVAVGGVAEEGAGGGVFGGLLGGGLFGGGC